MTIYSRSEPHMCRVFSKYVRLQLTVVNSQQKPILYFFFFCFMRRVAGKKKKPLQFHCQTLGVKGSFIILAMTDEKKARWEKFIKA